MVLMSNAIQTSQTTRGAATALYPGFLFKRHRTHSRSHAACVCKTFLFFFCESLSLAFTPSHLTLPLSPPQENISIPACNALWLRCCLYIRKHFCVLLAFCVLCTLIVMRLRHVLCACMRFITSRPCLLFDFLMNYVNITAV